MCTGEKSRSHACLAFFFPFSPPMKIYLATSLWVPHFWIHFFLNVKDFVSLTLLKHPLCGSFLAIPGRVSCFLPVPGALQAGRAVSTCCILHVSLAVPTQSLLCQGLCFQQGRECPAPGGCSLTGGWSRAVMAMVFLQCSPAGAAQTASLVSCAVAWLHSL